jgi:hypothetical protein
MSSLAPHNKGSTQGRAPLWVVGAASSAGLKVIGSLSSVGLVGVALDWEDVLHGRMVGEEPALIVAWPLRRSGRPQFPLHEGLLRKAAMPVVAMLRAEDSELLRELRKERVWVLHEDIREEDLRLIARHAIAAARGFLADP